MDRRQLARLAAPAAFLLAATVAILLVRSALSSNDVPARATTDTPTVAEARRQPAPAPATTAATTAPATSAAEGEFYVIEAGDTLESVADQYGTTVEELLVLNPDVDPVALTIGQRIRVS
ncbi:MAG: LysM domain-containing protein [Gemmatimonadota bacterium]